MDEIIETIPAEERNNLLLEGAYIQSPTYPGFWVSYEDVRERFNQLVAAQDSSVLEDFDRIFQTAFPNAKFIDNYQQKDSEDIFRAVRVTPNKLIRVNTLKKEIELAYNSATIWKDNWKAFASLGSKGLKSKCISMGFSGIRHAVECLFKTQFIFMTGDTSNHEPPILISKNADNDIESAKSEKSEKFESSLAHMSFRKQGSYIGQGISNFAFFPKNGCSLGWDAAINTLATDVALEERWYYHDTEEEKRNKPILKNYLSYTFDRLVYEDDEETKMAEKETRMPKLKILTNENNALFNTGLVNSLYEPIYAIFKKNDGRNKSIIQPWIFVAFATANSRYQSIITDFPYRPSRAEYFTDPADLLYDVNAEKPTINWEHIICENVSRLPQGFIKRGAPEGYMFDDNIKSKDKDSQRLYYSKLATDIKGDDDWMQFLTTKFRNSLDIALSRVAWNYKTAIPVYYVADHKLTLLLPLALEKKGIIDVALVCEHKKDKKKKINNYVGRTIFTLQMAYNNARLITRPDSDWLMADMCDN